ncbi:F-box/FBD/LRR-repeat protein-like [Iris pallida]|uniref:F-box/FBD/LRR-repeat protein-like n=1 Tax=Iris pallida TaxID=29817 RepID=A0AAX6FEG5_IRIPA|nr:F-box/FBD/LRR-repeat protein-like [Iris pallida]
MDRISSLPNHVIEAILKCLSLRDAVRTSILSRAWRDELCRVSQLVFDRETFPLLKGQGQKEYDKELVRVVDQVLLLHQGPIIRFKLSVDLTSDPNIDRWIRYLSRHGVVELILEIWNGWHYTLPSCFFMCREITYLKLYRCIFYPPPSFNGFKKLTVLDLKDVATSDEELGRLLSLCPLLRKLVLENVDCTTLRISNQKLVELSVVGQQILLYLESTPLLAIASITFSSCDEVEDGMVEDGMVPNIVNLLGNLPSIERLELFQCTLEALSIGDVPVSLPILCPLRHLSININFGNMRELLAAFCIFRSSFVLEKLDIDVAYLNTEGGMSADDFCQAQEEFSCNFTRLRTVEVEGFTGSSSELKFIAIILANAPLLEIMQIEFEDDVPGEILRQLVRLRRSSVKAEIIVLE